MTLTFCSVYCFTKEMVYCSFKILHAYQLSPLTCLMTKGTKDERVPQLSIQFLKLVIILTLS